MEIKADRISHLVIGILAEELCTYIYTAIKLSPPEAAEGEEQRVHSYVCAPHRQAGSPPALQSNELSEAARLFKTETGRFTQLCGNLISVFPIKPFPFHRLTSLLNDIMGERQKG